jgi:sec-independent protein translocase protein TatC
MAKDKQIEKGKEETNMEGKMPIVSLVSELLRRILYSVIAFVIITVIAFVYWHQIFEFLIAPAPDDIRLQSIEVMEGLSNIFKVCFTTGLIFSMPFLVYQLFAFLSPALKFSEKRYIFVSLPIITLLFIGGVAFAYYVALPPALGFLFTFGSDVLDVAPRITSYIDVITRMLVAVGLSFETPLILMVLAKIGVVNSQWLASKRKIWLIVAFVLAAIITPTFDPINQTIIALPLIVLYEVSIWLTKLVRRKPKQEPA